MAGLGHKRTNQKSLSPQHRGDVCDDAGEPKQNMDANDGKKDREVEDIANRYVGHPLQLPRLKHVHDQRREYPTQGNPVPPCPSIGPPSSPTGAQVSSGR